MSSYEVSDVSLRTSPHIGQIAICTAISGKATGHPCSVEAVQTSREHGNTDDGVGVGRGGAAASDAGSNYCSTDVKPQATRLAVLRPVQEKPGREQLAPEDLGVHAGLVPRTDGNITPEGMR